MAPSTLPPPPLHPTTTTTPPPSSAHLKDGHKLDPVVEGVEARVDQIDAYKGQQRGNGHHQVKRPREGHRCPRLVTLDDLEDRLDQEVLLREGPAGGVAKEEEDTGLVSLVPERRE